MVPARDLLLIFVRNPELGKCKTRLAAHIGDYNALEIYKLLLAHTQEVSGRSTATKRICYSDHIDTDDIWDSGAYDKTIQKGQHLGERMAHAFETGFREGFQKIVIIGSDLYDLSHGDLDTAFQALDMHDYVIGPAQDGGYYLLGMTNFNASLFKDKPWGTDTVLERTLKDLKMEKYFLMVPKNDIDRFEDIKDLEIFKSFLK